MNMDDFRFTEEHEWVYMEDGVAVMGISDYACEELGDIVFVELPEVGDAVQQKDAIGTIEAVKTVADLFSPVSGEVVEVNGDIVDDPGLIKESPFEEGWFLKIKAEDGSELDDMLDFKQYKEFIGK
ncbi:MAG: glycine cleavage system protein GcvH [Candidatus Latescibacteria bacterium]|nr:glycine cleavage system protein GcvH [bacterium]MBD3424408.1 glycine cleavage system protein GcvH [Candidatus Latescibacterota bacterium]